MRTTAQSKWVITCLCCALLACEMSTSLNDSSNSRQASENWVTGDIEAIIPGNELASVERAARGGSDDAAHRLAAHYVSLGREREQIEWLTLAATRGNCAAIDTLRQLAQNQSDLPLASRWNSQLRNHQCTWAKAYGTTQGDNSQLNDTPLWQD